MELLSQDVFALRTFAVFHDYNSIFFEYVTYNDMVMKNFRRFGIETHIQTFFVHIYVYDQIWIPGITFQAPIENI